MLVYTWTCIHVYVYAYINIACVHDRYVYRYMYNYVYEYLFYHVYMYELLYVYECICIYVFLLLNECHKYCTKGSVYKYFSSTFAFFNQVVEWCTLLKIVKNYVTWFIARYTIFQSLRFTGFTSLDLLLIMSMTDNYLLFCFFLLCTQVFLRVQFLALYFSPCIFSLRLPL